ncbi:MULTISPECIES: TonB-dependent receptor [unclassified Rhodanobacter]|uniref:Carboxypeptidase regulatory-like domain-containing protein n=1 Tax=Rhodanobacter humi TaxID=1888173 RepID=A0ABV4AMX0_9GAMM
MSNCTIFSTRQLRRTTLALSLGLGLGLVGTGAIAQQASGSIFGQVTGQHGGTVSIRNVNTGFERSIPVDSAGRYRITSLPIGTYTVTLQDNGQAVSTRENVLVNIAGGVEVSFGSAAGAKNLEGVSVVASALPSIDVSSVDTKTVFTASELAKLPMGRDLSSVALLAPSVINNSSYTAAPSFGGSAASENAYYINGYAVTNPLTALGFSTLPFDAIEQEQVLTGGYGAEFGRSTGGVINIITKRGTNEWKAGVFTYWSPERLRANPINQRYPNTGAYPATDGTLYAYRNKNQYSVVDYGAYVSGPLIKDRLFVYATGEITKRNGTSVSNAISTPTIANGWNEYSYKMPRWNAKIDWNINDSNILELTGVSDKTQYFSDLSRFNYNGYTHDDVQAGGLYTKDGGELYIGKYTGYITDSLTVSALYGEQTIQHVNTPWHYDPTCPRISGNTTAINQMPGITYYPACQFATTVLPLGAKDETHGWRLDVEYRISDHSLHVGADYQQAHSITGDEYAGGYVWVFQQTANKNNPINAGLGVGAPATGGNSGLGVPGPTPNKGYFTRRQYYTHFADVKVDQSSQFIEDRWQLNDNMLLVLGLRNEQFTNYTGDGVPFVSQRNQLAPRLGFSWDVFGDSSLKVFANAGRYHLAPPNNVAVRGAAASLYTQEYFTYTGTDPRTGAPTGLTPIAVDKSKGHVCPGPGNAVSSNLECGTAPDPRTVAAKGMKSHFQDEYILGMEQQLTPALNWGAKLTYRNLRSAIDDTCTQALGGACFLFNPGVANTFLEEQADGSFKEVTYSNAQLGMPKLKRQYYALDLFTTYKNDNWYGKLMYTFSRSYGDTEGQLASDLDTGSGGQADVSQTQDWDLPQLMVGSNGRLPNDRTHQIKAFGYYQITPEWRVGASAYITSGRPKTCTSFYPTPDAGLYTGAYYHYCGTPGTITLSPTLPNGQPNLAYQPPSPDYGLSPRGSKGSTPWVYTVNLNVAYTPEWANKQLTLQADVLNVFNQQVPQAYNPQYATDTVTRSQFYGQELGFTAPRSVRLSARYDFSL